MNALDKVIAILEAFLVESDELRLADLCRITGLNKSTTYVIAQALVDRGYLNQSGKRGTYFLGLRFVELGNVVRSKLNVADVALPLMTALNAETNETVELAVRDGSFCAILATVRANRLLAASGTGKWAARIPMHNTACGKVLLAFVDPDEWPTLRRRLKLTPETPKTITALTELETHLDKVRSEAMAVDDEEAELGIRSIGVPIMDSSGSVIAALDIIGPKSRFNNVQMSEYKQLVRRCGASISQAMGYRAGR